MEQLAIQAGRALVRAAAGDDWPRVRAALTDLWAQAYPEAPAGGVRAELEGLRGQVTQARSTGDAAAEQALVQAWRARLQQLLETDPGLAAGLTSVLLSPPRQAGQGAPAGDDSTTMRTTVIGQAAAGLTAAAAVIYGAGALTIALRLHFSRLPWEAVLGQLPRDLMLTTGFGQIILPAMIIGLLGAVLLNFVVNGIHGPAGSWLQWKVQRYLTASPTVRHGLMWLLVTALFGTLEPLISLYFYLSYRKHLSSSQFVIPAPEAMLTAGVLCAAAVGVALILLPAPTAAGLDQGWNATRQVYDWKEPSADGPATTGCWSQLRRKVQMAEKGVARWWPDPPEQSATSSSLGSAAWQAWVAVLVGFAAIPGIATFSAVTLFPASTACTAEVAGGRVTGGLIATNGGWAYMAEYYTLEPKAVRIFVLPLSSVRLQTIGIESDCSILAHAPTVTNELASEVSSSTATVSGLVYPAGEATTYQVRYGTTASYGFTVPAPARYAGQGTSAAIALFTLTGLKPGTKYHYQIVATNATGTFGGRGTTFTTTKQHP